MNDSKGLVSFTGKVGSIHDISTAPCWMMEVIFGISSSEDRSTPSFMRDQRLENDCAREMFALQIGYFPFLVSNFTSTPFKDFADLFEYVVDIAAKNNQMFKKKLKMSYKIAGDEVMLRLSKANISRPREMWDAISIKFAKFYLNEYSAIGETFVAGLGYYVREIAAIATQYKVTYWCRFILTGEGGSGKTHFLLYLCRALMTTDLRMKLSLGKELSRSKDALISTCRIYDEHFSTVPKNPKNKRERGAVRKKSVVFNFTEAEKPLQIIYKNDAKQPKFSPSIFAGASGPESLPTEEEYAEIFKDVSKDLKKEFTIWQPQANRRFVCAKMTNAFRSYSERFFSNDLLSEGILVFN